MTSTHPATPAPGPVDPAVPAGHRVPDDLRTPGQAPGQLREHIAAVLERARRRTAALTDAVDDADLTRAHSPLMSPLVWDLAHVGSVEELWLLRELGGRDPMQPEAIDRLYNAFEHPRSTRPSLPLLDPAASRRYIAQVRARVLGVLETVPLEGRPLLDGGFVFAMVAQHEQQHDETMLATHQLRLGAPALTAPPPPAAGPGSGRAGLPAEVLVDAGEFEQGTSTHPWAWTTSDPRTGCTCPRSGSIPRR